MSSQHLNFEMLALHKVLVLEGGVIGHEGGAFLNKTFKEAPESCLAPPDMPGKNKVVLCSELGGRAP